MGGQRALNPYLFAELLRFLVDFHGITGTPENRRTEFVSAESYS